MTKIRHITLLSLAVILIAAVVPVFGGGAVYDELPDLGGAEVVVAVENFYMPYQFVDPREDNPIGFEYDIVNEVCRRVNCTPVYETTTFELQLTGVEAGQYDMAMNGLFITEERQAIYDFTIPYSQAETFLLTRADEDRFANVQEFLDKAESDNLIWGVQNNSFGQYLATEEFQVPASQIVTFDDFNSLLLALVNGDIDTMNADGFGGKFVSANGDQFKLIGDPLVEPVPLGFLFTKGSEFVAAFNAALESMMADGYMDYLVYKWSVDFTPVAE